MSGVTVVLFLEYLISVSSHLMVFGLLVSGHLPLSTGTVIFKIFEDIIWSLGCHHLPLGKIFICFCSSLGGVAVRNLKTCPLYLCIRDRIEDWYFNLCFVKAEKCSSGDEWQPWTARKSMDKTCFHCIVYTNYFNHKIWQLVNNGLRNPEKREVTLI